MVCHYTQGVMLPVCDNNITVSAAQTITKADILHTVLHQVGSRATHEYTLNRCIVYRTAYGNFLSLSQATEKLTADEMQAARSSHGIRTLQQVQSSLRMKQH